MTGRKYSEFLFNFAGFVEINRAPPKPAKNKRASVSLRYGKKSDGNQKIKHMRMHARATMISLLASSIFTRIRPARDLCGADNRIRLHRGVWKVWYAFS